ncbi:MAG: hypothetical protein ABI036_07535 [Fibrobacteria bacterium]
MRDARRSHYDSHPSHGTHLNARAQLIADLSRSRHSHLLVWSGTPEGAVWATHKGAGRVGALLKQKKEQEAKSALPAEGEGSEEVGRLVSIELECQHAEEKEKHGGDGGAPEGQDGPEPDKHKGSAKKPARKPRWAESGEVLSIVPSAAGSDTVKLKARTERNPAWISWTGKGWKGFTHQGEEYSYKVPGYGLNSIIDLLPENGIWGARISPKVIEIEAADPDGRTSRAKIAVYPDHSNTIKGRIGEKAYGRGW